MAQTKRPKWSGRAKSRSNTEQISSIIRIAVFSVVVFIIFFAYNLKIISLNLELSKCDGSDHINANEPEQLLLKSRMKEHHDEYLLRHELNQTTQRLHAMEREVLTLLRGAAKAEAPQQQKPAQQQKPEEKAVSSATADIPVGDTSNNATTQIQQTADDKQQPLLPPLEIQYTADNKPLLPPRKIIATNFPVYYMHIGKTGGSSVCGLMKTLNNKKAFRGKQYLLKGQNHFDWSFIQQDRINSGRVRGKSKYDPHLEEYDVSNNTDVLTFLRNPVQRAISQFYYAQRNRWVASKKKREPSWNPKWTTQTMDEYMNDTKKDFMQPLSDGEGGVRWLAGTWKRNDWVSTSDESDTKRYRRQNKTAAALLAAQRLASTTWFGLLEEKDRSMKLLQLTLDLDAPPTLPKANSGHNKAQTQNETMKKIKPYLPQDMWLYEYAKRLFEARWEYFAGDGTYTHPELPPLPNFSTDAVHEAEVFFANQQPD